MFSNPQNKTNAMQKIDNFLKHKQTPKMFCNMKTKLSRKHNIILCKRKHLYNNNNMFFFFLLCLTQQTIPIPLRQLQKDFGGGPRFFFLFSAGTYRCCTCKQLLFSNVILHL